MLTLISCFFVVTGIFAARKQVTVEKITSSITLSEAVDYHITASTGCIAEGVTVNLAHEDAWLIFDNVQPVTVSSKWLSYVRINGAAVVGSKIMVNIYKQGAAVIPYGGTAFAPLTIYTDEAYGGSSKAYVPGRYTALGSFNNKIKSFKLKRGYMATMAQASDGGGYSRVFMAHDEDIDIPNLADPKACVRGGALYNKVSYIRVMRIHMPSKKGAVDTDPEKTNSTWYYNYDASLASKNNNIEYVNMWHHASWNVGASTANQSDVSGVTHTLFFNEPWNKDDNKDEDKPKEYGYNKYDPSKPLQAIGGLQTPMHYQQILVKNGTRIGSMASTDGNIENTKLFVAECDRLGLRIDFVAIHVYQYQSAQWWADYAYNIYKATGRPIWITEWNNGANWTSEGGWPSDLGSQWIKSRDITDAVIKKLADAPWVERFSLYSNVQVRRNITYYDHDRHEKGKLDTVATINGVTKTYHEGDLTPSGEAYKAFQPGFAYNPAYEFIPIYPKFTTPVALVNSSTLASVGQVYITLTDNNGEYLDKYVIERKFVDSDWEVIKEGTTANGTIIKDNWGIGNVQKASYRIHFYYCNETTARYTIEESIDVDEAQGDLIRYGTVSLSKPDWAYVLYEPFGNGVVGMPVFGGTPAASVAGQSNQALCMLNASLKEGNFRAKLVPWGFVYNYTEATLDGLTYGTTVRAPFMVVDTTSKSLQTIPAETGVVKAVSSEWVQVNFKEIFEDAPVVFPVVLGASNFAANKAHVFPRVRNVTKDGFEVRLTREAAIAAAWPRSGENVGYYAALPGTTKIVNPKTLDTLHVTIARTGAVNGGLTSTEITSFPEIYPADVTPTVVSALQSSNDTYTSILVYGALTNTSVRFYKVREKPTVSSPTTVSKDEVGYIAFYTSKSTSPSPGPVGFDEMEAAVDFGLYEQDGIVYISGMKGTTAMLYNSTGAQLCVVSPNKGLDTSVLPAGYYVIRTDKNESASFVKH